jgi:phage tail sheath protein FI
MSEIILSPGVFQIESDQSLYTQAPQVLGAAIVGPTVGGLPMVPTYVTTYSQYLSLFGDVFKSGSYYYEYFTSMAAREYFNNGGQTLLVTRIISGSDYDTYASSDVISQATIGDKFATGSGVLAAAFIDNDEVKVVNGSTTYRFIASGNPIPADNATGNVYFFSTGSNTNGSVTNLTNKINSSIPSVVTASASTNTIILSGSVAGATYNGVTLATGSASSFSTLITLGGGTNVSTQATSFTLETLSWGDQMNNSGSETNGALASGSAYNVRWEVTNVNTGSGTFTLVVRRGDDNTSQKNILETWANMSLDPQQPNYISRVIGDLKPVYNATENYVQYNGTYANVSRYIRVSSVVTPNADSLDNNGNFKTSLYASTLPLVGSGSFGGGVADTDRAKLMNEAITISNIQGFSPNDYTEAFQMLSNTDEYRFNVLLAPGLGLDTSAADDMISTAEGRGDAIAIVDNGKYGTAINQATQNAAGQSSNYAATYYPWIQLYSSNLGKSVWCPPSTVIGGVLAFNDQVGAEWFAPAGLNRGGIPSVVRAERRLQQTDRDTLYTANVNPLATFPGTGVCVWGQKTLQRKPTALDRVNVRRLLIALKDYIGNVSRTLVFEQNTTVTRNRFLSQVNPYLSSVVQRQGLYAYKVVMDDTNNTPDVVDRNQLVGQIYIQPTKTAEYIILNFNILPTGATFD